MSDQAPTINVHSVHWLSTDPPRPAPTIMSEEETIIFLRINTIGIAKPRNTLAYWRNRGFLKSMRVSNKFVYRLEDALAFAERLSKASEHPDLKKPTEAFGKNRPRRKVQATGGAA